MSKVVRGLVRDPELLNANLGSHWKLTYPEDPSVCVDVTSKLQFTLTLLMCCTTASKYGYIGQRMDIPIPCTFSITGCTKLIMVANPILSGAL